MGTQKTQPQTDRNRSDFELGSTYVTRGVHESVPVGDVLGCLSRHRRCDWGNLDPEDRESNERALQSGGRLVSAYQLSDDRKLWVITEAEDDEGCRRATTVLFPSEY
jgi:hypothetical protein